jgi:CRISPR-associated RAMP protein (TIGR02581 family)
MHRKRWNAIHVLFELHPCSPLLVKSGTLSPNPSLPDMQFVRTQGPQGEEVFIPGSSLKGVFRSFTERVLRTFGGERLACDPLGKESCGRKKEVEDAAKQGNSALVYRESCLACKVYGHTRLRGRLSFTDAFPEGNWKTEIRYGVAISRLSGAVAVGPFDMEVLVEGHFVGSLLLENFEVWQLGLLGLTIRSLNEGLTRVGFGKSRGFGEVRMRVREMTVEMAKVAGLSPGELWGAGAFAGDAERKAYGLRSDDRLKGIPEGAPRDLGVYVRTVYGPQEGQEVLERAAECLGSFFGG